MRVILDTNILVSALIAPAGKPAAIVDAWLDGNFTLLIGYHHATRIISANNIAALVA
ncbi:MAG: PIN domain-containing protein [Terriglobales bacterium]